MSCSGFIDVTPNDDVTRNPYAATLLTSTRSSGRALLAESGTGTYQA
jgi:hypothetical protein